MVSKIARAIASYLLHRARKSAKLHNRVMGLSRARSTRSSIDLRFNVARIIATNNLEAKDTAPVAFPSDASSYLLLALYGSSDGEGGAGASTSDRSRSHAGAWVRWVSCIASAA